MLKSPTAALFRFRKQPFRTWGPQVLVTLYLFATLAVYLAAPMLAASWLKTPFIGGFVEQTMLFNGTGSSETPSQWGAVNQGLRFGNQLLAIDGLPVSDAAELQAALAGYQPGDEVSLGVLTVAGEKRDFSVELIRFPDRDRLTFIYIPYLMGLIYLVSALWVFFIRRSQASGQVYAVFASSVAIITGGLFDLYTTHWFTSLWTLALLLAGASILDLAALFPITDRMVARHGWLRVIPYAGAGFLFAYSLTRLHDMAHPAIYAVVWQAGYVFSGACLGVALLWLLVRRMRMTSPIAREQVRLILLGALVAFGPVVAWFLGSPLWIYTFPFTPYLLLPIVFFPLATGYAIQRYRTLQTDFVLSRGVLYGLLAILVSVGYALLVTGLAMVLTGPFSVTNPIISGLIIFLLVMAINPLRQRLEKAVDVLFFRGERAYQERLKTFGGELTALVDQNGIIRVLQDTIQGALAPACLHVYLHEPLSDTYFTVAGGDGKPTSDLRFTAASPLVQELDQRKTAIFISDMAELPPELMPEQARLALLGAQVFVPLPGLKRLAGWMSLGARLTGEPYSSRDVGFLESLADQVALAIERAQVVANLESRVREMNVLTRISQGINVTLSLDDVLELIYAQTTQIIPADDFHMALLDPASGDLTDIFYVEANDRLTGRENLPPTGVPQLENEVVRQRRGILVDDYNRQARSFGIAASRPGVFAWMGVPLNTGAETIGALSIGKRDAGVLYNRQQQNLLQAIADQAAGAIIKARLLQESEKRARQLATLNDLTRQLTGTLETEPLLTIIIESAVEILSCEAGSLLMVDEQTDELVFRVITGPVARELLNRRLPPGSGVVGQAVSTRQPVIVNDVQKSATWFSKTDRQTGFETRALLAIPLIVKDEVIGVLEVINKTDHSPFTIDDQELLTAFAAQAAVALENARLYTLTDLALAERVEELSVMQRIDRELNTSLDTERAMNITLEWALRQSRASAGLVGTVGEDALRIIAHQGYSDEINAFEDKLVPLERIPVKKLGSLEIPQSEALTGDGAGLLHNAHSLTVVPIRREGEQMGVLVLESASPELFPEETLNFLQRLSDHAAIAISNAQLYAAVQSANLAKSEFVSFVSHELKNPMTSIKGYTELLAAGAVGPVTDAQANFLSTIRSNVERMSTLVSDLADVSRIEAGRLKLEFKEVKLVEVMEEIGRSMKRQVEEKNQTVSVEIPEDLPPVWADRTRLVQVITNLVSNANKYTPAGGQIRVAARASENRWDLSGAGQVVHVQVEDSGIGISEEDAGKIFTKFFRSEDPKTREAPGTGLGLNITKSLVELQGGKIWFESEIGKGSIFHFTIPVAG